MGFAEGEIVEGKVSGIAKYGVFVSLPDGKSGLVHISEISDKYVTDIKDFAAVGQEVRVMVLAEEKAGKINLSLKRVAAQQNGAPAAKEQAQAPQRRQRSTEPVFTGVARKPAPESFEDKLKAFMKDSESKMSDMKNPPEKRSATSRRSRSKQ